MISYYKRINLHIHRTTMLIVVNNNDIILQANKLTCIVQCDRGLGIYKIMEFLSARKECRSRRF